MVDDKVLSAIRDQIGDGKCNEETMSAIVVMLQVVHVLCPAKRIPIYLILKALTNCGPC